MAIDIDGMDVLIKMHKASDIFKSVDQEVTKLAHSIAGKAVKAKNMDTDMLRDIRRVLGDESFMTLLDGWEPKGVLAKVDKENKDIKTAGKDEQRARVAAIASGADPVLPAPKPVKAPAGPKKTGQRALTSKAVKTKRDPLKNPDA